MAESETEAGWISKSQRKRDSAALQALAAELATLSPELLAQMALAPDLLEALLEAKRIDGQRGAYKRQIKYAGGLLRELDAEPIRAALARIKNRSAEAAGALHRIESWRERLLQEGDEAVAALLVICPQVDCQQLRQLIRSAQREQAAGKPPRAYRALFRLLREFLDSPGAEPS